MNKIASLVAALVLAGAPAQAETALIDLPFQSEFRVEESFIEVYLRTTERLIACHANASIVDIIPQLFPDFGYGVIDAAYNLGEPDPFFRVRLQEEGDSTVVSLKTTVGSDMEDYPKPALDWLEYWVMGGTTCIQNGYHEPVPGL